MTDRASRHPAAVEMPEFVDAPVLATATPDDVAGKEETVPLARHVTILQELARLRSEVERLEAELKTTRELHTALWRAVDAHMRAREKGLNVAAGGLWYELAGAWVAYPPAPIWTCPECGRTALSGIDTACPGCGREVPAFGTALGGNLTEDAAATTR